METQMSDLERYFARPEPFADLKIEEYYHQVIIADKPPGRGREFWMDNPPHPAIPRKYVYLRVRNVDKQVARLTSMLPTAGEVWYLRLLLKHVPLRSFAHGYNITDDNGHLIHECTTYQEAALHLGLAQAENEGNLTFEEAVNLLRPPAQLRALLVTLISGGYPMAASFNTYRVQMALDYRPDCATDEEAENKLLTDLARRLHNLGFGMTEVGLPEPLDANSAYDADLLRYNRDQQLAIFNHLWHQSSDEQRAIINAATDLTDTLPVMVHAPAGFGKSHSFNAIAAKVRSEGKTLAIMASTGLAALSFPGGRTCHATFKMNIVEDPSVDEIQCDFGDTTDKADFLRRIDILIWDEAPMAHRAWMEAIDKKLRQVTQLDAPFGGKKMILGGDFRYDTEH